MAYHKPSDLDGFIGQMGKADMRIRAQLAEDLVNYLSDSENSLVCSDLGMLIDGLIPWLSGSHFKVQLIYCSLGYAGGLEIISILSGRDPEGNRNL